MRFFFLALFLTLYAKSDKEMVNALVESTVSLVSRNLEARVSHLLNQIELPTKSLKNELSKYVNETFIIPTIAEERSLLRREIHRVLEIKQPVRPLKVFYSISDKMIKMMQYNFLKWIQYHKHQTHLINNRKGLKKRDFTDDEGYQFPHLFDGSGVFSTLIDYFFYTIALTPLYNLFDNQSFKGVLQIWLIQNFMVNPLYNRLMYGYYLYQPDQYEYY